MINAAKNQQMPESGWWATGSYDNGTSGNQILMKRRGFFFGLVALLASGCTVGPEIADPEMDMAGQFFNARPSSPITLMDARWWEAFGDPTMNELVELGPNLNLDIRRAEKRCSLRPRKFSLTGLLIASIPDAVSVRRGGIIPRPARPSET